MSPRTDRGLRIAGRACAALLLTLFVIFLVAPVVVVVLMSFTNQLYLAFPPTRLVLRWCLRCCPARSAGCVRHGTAFRSALQRRWCR